MNQSIESNSEAAPQPLPPSTRRRGTFSLAWLLGLVSVAAVWFGLMTYSSGFGLAIAVIGLQIYLRVRWHRFTSWKLGWKIGVGPALTTLIFMLMCMSGIYGVVYALTTMGVAQVMQMQFIEHDLPLNLQWIPRAFAWASALIMIESFVVFSLRKHPDPI